MRSMHGILVLLILLGLITAATADPWDDLASAWTAGDLVAARAAFADLDAEALASPAGRAWRFRLADDPEAIDATAATSPAQRLEAAWIAWGSGDHEQAASLMTAATAGSEDPAIGDPFLAGLLARRAGDRDAARDALASVRPDEPSFAWARYTLGRMAAADGDAVLARRYYDNADDAPAPLCRADVLAATWELVRGGDPRQAERLERELGNRYPDSLPLIRIRELSRRRLAVETADTPSDRPRGEATTPPAEVVADDARYTLQLGAFGDRGRALTFRDEWRGVLGDVEIVAGSDASGRTVHRVRAGRFHSRQRAASRADELRREHDLSCLVVERDPSP